MSADNNAPFIKQYIAEVNALSEIGFEEHQPGYYLPSSYSGSSNMDNPSIKIHFILDGLLKLEDITSSQYQGYTTAELRTTIREGYQGRLAGKVVFWLRQETISFQHLTDILAQKGLAPVVPSKSPEHKKHRPCRRHGGIFARFQPIRPLLF